MRTYQEALHSIKRLYISSDFVSRKEFGDFAKEMLKSYSAIQALEWIPRVKYSEKSRYENNAHKDGYKDFAIVEKKDTTMVPVEKRDEYFPVYYLEPYQSNKKVLGFDLASNPARLAALESAMDSGKQVATRPITLLQETGKQNGFLVFSPIYRKDSPTEATYNRREYLQGFALGVFRIGDMIDAIFIDRFKKSMNLYIYDADLSGSGATLYGLEDVNAVFSYKTVVDIAGRRWTLEFTPTAVFAKGQRGWQAWTAFIVGLLFTSLLQAFLLIMTARTETIKKLVSERTAELCESQTQL